VKVFECPYTIHHSVGGLHTTRGGVGGAAGGAISHEMTMLVVLVLLLVSHSQSVSSRKMVMTSSVV